MNGQSQHYMNQLDFDVSVPEYEIRNIDNKTYMFLQWKSWDYMSSAYMNKWERPMYYVFEKVANYEGNDQLFDKVLSAKAEVETEYNTWSQVSPSQRKLPKNQKTPFRIMWLVYTDAAYEGKEYKVNNSTLSDFKKSLTKFEKLVETLSDGNVDIINDYKIIDRQVEAVWDQRGLPMKLIAIPPSIAAPDMESYAPIGEYDFVYTVSTVPSDYHGNYRSVYSGQGFASIHIDDITGNSQYGIEGVYLHEMLHAFEFGSAQPINIEMPLVHINEAMFPVGYEDYAPGGKWSNNNIEELMAKAEVKYTDPETKKISYVGIYPSLWKYVAALHDYLANIEKVDVKPSIPVPTPTPTLTPVPTPTPVNTSGEIWVVVNGSKLEFDQPPILENGRTLVPLRAIFEALGAAVQWDSENQIIIANRNGTMIEMQIGSNILQRDSSDIELDVPPQLVNGRTLVPVRAVAESFNATVSWKGETTTVTIETK